MDFIGSKQKLERDKGLELIKEVLRSPGDGEVATLEQNLLGLLVESEGWEGVLGALSGTTLMLAAGKGSDEFCNKIQAAVPDMLEHEEPRVRISTGMTG